MRAKIAAKCVHADRGRQGVGSILALRCAASQDNVAQYNVSERKSFFTSKPWWAHIMQAHHAGVLHLHDFEVVAGGRRQVQVPVGLSGSSVSIHSGNSYAFHSMRQRVGTGADRSSASKLC